MDTESPAPKAEDVWRTATGSRIVAWYIMRNDIGMSEGKLGVQIGHGTDFIHMKGAANPYYDEWMRETGGNRRKVILRVKSESDIDKLKKACEDAGMLVQKIYDAGLTEFGKTTLTGLVVLPHDDSKAPKPLQRTQAWKSHQPPPESKL